MSTADRLLEIYPGCGDSPLAIDHLRVLIYVDAVRKQS